jgi:hypothetical protein
MSLLRRILKLLHVKKGMILVYVLNTIILILASYIFYGVNDVLYPLGVSLFLLLVYLAISVFRFTRFTDKLADSRTSPHLEVDHTDVPDKLTTTPGSISSAARSKRGTPCSPSGFTI